MDQATEEYVSDHPGEVCRCGHHHAHHEMMEVADGHDGVEVIFYCLLCGCEDYAGPEA